mmetsp:Transcript_51098/g.91766  ORF Transcript_51098/g.91766 Transcript_51098/m.91766 type:complete len:200 (+) Transcript_51098:428-1027(+)
MALMTAKDDMPGATKRRPNSNGAMFRMILALVAASTRRYARQTMRPKQIPKTCRVASSGSGMKATQQRAKGSWVCSKATACFLCSFLLSLLDVPVRLKSSFGKPMTEGAISSGSVGAGGRSKSPSPGLRSTSAGAEFGRSSSANISAARAPCTSSPLGLTGEGSSFFFFLTWATSSALTRPIERTTLAAILLLNLMKTQ